MTRKDFELIAEVIASLPYDAKGNYVTGPLEIAEAFATRLKLVNPRFDSARFIKACTSKVDITV